jgi:hypothetical protein
MILNESYSKMMNNFNQTLSLMNNLNEKLKTKEKEVRESYSIICKNYLDTRDNFQKFFISLSECLVIYNN